MTTDTAEQKARDYAQRCGWALKEPGWRRVHEDDLTKAFAAALREQQASPIDMLLWCPSCGVQHVDEPDERSPDWQNPPHRSHLCHGCGHIWRPADIATNGVRSIKTRGKNDSPSPLREQQAWRPIDENTPKTKREDMRALPFLAWCPDRTAPLGGDHRIVWWEPLLKKGAGCWWSDRDMEEHPTHYMPALPSPPESSHG